jgi:hypothetical protein
MVARLSSAGVGGLTNTAAVLLHRFARALVSRRTASSTVARGQPQIHPHVAVALGAELLSLVQPEPGEQFSGLCPLHGVGSRPLDDLVEDRAR